MYDRDVRIELRPSSSSSSPILHIETASRYAVACITSYDLLDGAHYELLAANEAVGKLYTYELAHQGIFSTYIDLGSDKIFQKWYAYDGARSWHRLEGEALLEALAAHFPLTFSDIRSIVQRAFETTQVPQARALWSRCRDATKMLTSKRPDFHLPALHYTRDHLERYIEREPMVDLQGTTDQNRWARKLRLRAIQRLGLMASQRGDDLDLQIDALFGKLAARTFHDSQHWIAANQLIQSGSAEETLAWLLRELG